MRRKFNLFLAGLLISLVSFSQVLAANFSDVPETHPHARAIISLKEANVISGYPDGQFRPEQGVNRAEAVAIILKAAGITAVRTDAGIPFTDVPQDAWFFPMIQKGVSMGKLQGYPDSTFKPGNPISMPEAIALTLSFFQVGVSGVNVENTIYDGLSVHDWYAQRMQFAKNNNLIEPDSHGFISPTAALNRGQLAEIIYRMRWFAENHRPYDLTIGWQTAEHPDNFWRVKHPAGWQIFKGLRNSVIWTPDIDVGVTNAFFTRVWPGTARVSISIIENPENLTPAQYFSRLKNLYERTYSRVKTRSSQITVSGKQAFRVFISDRRMVDLFVALPNRKFLGFYGEYGEGKIGEFMKKQIEAVEMSYEYIEPQAAAPVLPLAERMQRLRENLLVANKWGEIAPLFPDKRLINTDAIGVGTGPVDYYYSREANQTIKLERNSGTVLNIREGETNSF